MDRLEQRLTTALDGGYRLERELGGGGMSRVFLARDTELDRQVVIKVHPHEVDGLSGDRFRREIQVAAKLQHPNLVPVLAAGDAGGMLYFIMPYVAGESLRELLDREGALTPPRARMVLRDAARALAFAHAHDIVHRDIKPANILLAGDAAMVTDFGVAKALSSAAGSDASLTGIGMSLGTPSYMAPEQAAGDSGVDHRADLYAWGCLAYELLLGQPPFTGKSAQQLVVAHLTEAPSDLAERCPEVPAEISSLVMQCLQKDPADRPQSAGLLVDALEHAGEFGSARRPRTWRLVAVAAMVLLVGAVGLLISRGGSNATPEAGSLHTVAVLPLSSIGGEDDYFADGMTEELIIALSRVPDLRVASRTSVFAYKDAGDLDVREIAKRLSVGTVLEGSIRRAGGQLRLSAQLTSAADGLTLWSESFQRAEADLFQVQDDLARAVAAALSVQLGRGPAEFRGTTDPVAYDLFLQARHRWRARGAPALQDAAALYARAIARDSSFARAWAGLADALALLPLYGSTALDSVLGPAREAAGRAVALDSTLSAAHATLGNLALSAGDWDVARQSLTRAIALDSNEATPQQWLGEVEFLTGNLDRAVAPLRRAAALDTSAALPVAELAHVYGLMGRDTEARTMIDRAVTIAPDLGPIYLFWGSVEMSAGRFRDAAERFAHAVELSPQFTAGAALRCVALREAADPSAGAFCDGVASGPAGSPIVDALLAHARGDRGAMYVALERAVDAHDPVLYASSLNAPWWRTLHAEARFRALAERMGVRLQAP